MRPLPRSEFDLDAVRFGEPADEAQIRLLLMLGHAENSIFKFNIEKAVFIIRRLLFTSWLPASDPGIRGCFGVIGPRGGILEGLAMMAVSQQWYTHAPYLEEFIVYVHPDYRHKGHARALLDWMIARSDQMRIPLLTGIISQTRMEAKCRMYQRHPGIKKVGEFYLHMPESMRWESDVILSEAIRPPSSAAVLQ